MALPVSAAAAMAAAPGGMVTAAAAAAAAAAPGGSFDLGFCGVFPQEGVRLDVHLHLVVAHIGGGRRCRLELVLTLDAEVYHQRHAGPHDAGNEDPPAPLEGQPICFNELAVVVQIQIGFRAGIMAAAKAAYDRSKELGSKK